jgi:hypothetical protein
MIEADIGKASRLVCDGAVVLRRLSKKEGVITVSFMIVSAEKVINYLALIYVPVINKYT